MNKTKQTEAETERNPTGENTSGIELEQLENPFSRSLVMRRSPDQLQNKERSNEQEATRRTARPTKYLGITDTPIRSRSSPPTLQTDEQENGGGKDDGHLAELGRKIQELVEMMGGGRRSIHQPMRDLVAQIADKYDQAANTLSSTARSEVCNKSVQTTIQALRNDTPKRQREEAATRTTPPKKTKRPLYTRAQEVTREPQKEPTASKHREDVADKGRGIDAKAIERKTREEVGNRWTKVVAKPNKRIAKPRPDALVIKIGEGQTYADILRKVKNDPALKPLGNNVQQVRRTQRGELLLELKKAAVGSPRAHKTTIEKALNDQVEVRVLRHEIQLEIKDIDEITSKSEVTQALKDQLPSGTSAAVVTMRKAYGGTQIATISAQAQDAPKIIEKGKIRIGWTICRIREKCVPVQCYKCLQFGHVARHCKSKENMTGMCYKCGSKEHKAKECNAEPRCLLCKGQTGKDDKHSTGSRQCPYYKNALRELIKKK
jgi:Zinc knuckle